MRKPRSSQAGLTLIETLAAVTVFAFVTVGIVPLLATSLRGSASSRDYTVAKNLAVDSMERIRGLPFHVAYDSVSKKVDVLDLYFPCAANPYSSTVANGCPSNGGTYDAANWRFLTTCSAGVSNPACPVDRPAGYNVVFCAQFVGSQAGAVATQTPCGGSAATTDFPPRQPISNYSWYKPLGSTNTDSPTTQLVQMRVTVMWRVPGSTSTCATLPVPSGCRNVSLTTLIGARKFGIVKISGDSRIDYGLRVVTRFRDVTSPRGSTGLVTSTLTATAGGAESNIEQRLLSSASQRLLASQLQLVEEPTPTNPSQLDLGTITGLVFSVNAPNDQEPIVPAGNSGKIRHEYLAVPKDVAGTASTSTLTSPDQVKVGTSEELPYAQGGFLFGNSAPGGPSGTGNSGHFYVDNEAVVGGATFLAPSQPMFTLRRNPANETMRGKTSASTGRLQTAGRGVFSSATTSFARLRLLPVTFLVGGPNAGPSDFESVFSIENFSARVTCNATANPTTSGIGTSAGGDQTQWTATVKFWSDPVNNGSTIQGTTAVAPAFQTIQMSAVAGGDVTVSGTVNYAGVAGTTNTVTYPAGTPFSAFLNDLTIRNVLVYDGATLAQDVHLFKDLSHPLGYLSQWTASPPTGSYDSVNGLTAQASIDEAMSIVTVPTDVTLDESALAVSIGKLSCQALDRR